jgi:4-amino-4-deoxy-L-arabinose transferase-like glycosyltransferase
MRIEAQLRKAAPRLRKEYSQPSDIDLGAVTLMVTSQGAKRPTSISEPFTSKGRFWLWFTAFSLLLILMAAARWIFDHPYAVHADEAAYINQVQLDVHRLLSGDLVRLAGRIILGDRNRPPAYRILALPVLALAGFHTETARFVSLALSGMSLWFICLTARRVATYMAGAVAVLFFLLSPEVVSASMLFSTEGPLFLATSAMLYFLSAYWSEGAEHAGDWMGLGLAIGLGLLSKASFVLLLFPVSVFSLFVIRQRLACPSFAALLKAGALGFALAAPWWLVNVRAALGYAKFAIDSPRNSLGRPGLHTWAKWSATVAQGLLGHGLTVVAVLVVVAALRKIAIRREPILNIAQRTALMACIYGVLPIVIVQAAGVNHLLRYLTPALIPLAIIVGVLADRIGWTCQWRYVAALALCFSLQLIVIVSPVVFPNTRPVDPGFANGGLPWRAMVRFDQWDWKPIRDISHDCGIETPRISYLGNGRTFTPAHVEYPWILAGAQPPDVKWLWRYEDGPMDWRRVWSSVGESDIVLTAPRYVGQVSDWQDLDNQHNAELAGQLAQDSRFRKPIRLEMGRFEPVEVLVFLKKDLVCHSDKG